MTKILVSLAGGQPGAVSLPDLPTGIAVMTAGGGAYTCILSTEAMATEAPTNYAVQPTVA